MKSCVRFLGSSAILIAFVFALSSHLTAQSASATKHNANYSSPAPIPLKVEPFKIGETLVYEAKFSRLLLRGIDVADLTFTVADDVKKSPNKIQLKAEVISKGSLLKLVSYSFLQKFDSTVQTDNFRILQTVRYDEQDKRIRTSNADFDYVSNKLIYRESDPNNLMSAPRMIISPLESSAQDLISAFYYLRSQPLAVGQEFTIRLSDSGVVYEVPVKVVARELLKSVLGKLWTLRIEPQLFGEKRPLPGEGKLLIWVTDDARHIPIRSQIQASIGKVEIKLRSTTNLQAIK